MRLLRRFLGSVSLVVGSATVACNGGDPTQAVVENRFPAPADGGGGPQTVVYKTWWVVTLFPDPIAAGASSGVNRVVPSSDYAYALLAPAWDPASGAPPAALLPVRTKTPISVAEGEMLHIAISDATVDGDCAAGSPLAQDVADLVTKSIFPGEFAGMTYDAATCTATPTASDAGAD
jgi:hypothetical protein